MRARPARYAVVSCHVENLLDDRVWAAYHDLIRSRPSGFAVASLVRPPHECEHADESRWLARAREAATYGPLGHHTHFGGPSLARPAAGGEPPAERVGAEAAWMRAAGLEPRYFCGGGWYIDDDVAATLAGLAYADLSATPSPPAYLRPDQLVATSFEPAWVEPAPGARLLLLPTTHSTGAFWAALARGALPDVVHLYFHDHDLVDRRRQSALVAALRVLARVRRPRDVAHHADVAGASAPTLPWVSVKRP